MMLQPVRREKKCKGCATPFLPARPLQVACSPDCARIVAQRNRERAEKRAATIEFEGGESRIHAESMALREVVEHLGKASGREAYDHMNARRAAA